MAHDFVKIHYVEGVRQNAECDLPRPKLSAYLVHHATKRSVSAEYPPELGPLAGAACTAIAINHAFHADEATEQWRTSQACLTSQSSCMK